MEWLLRELESEDLERRKVAYVQACRQPTLPAPEALVKLLLAWLESPDGTRHWYASVLLTRMGEAVLPRIAALHSSSNVRARGKGVTALLQLRNAGTPIEGPSTLDLLKDQDKSIRDLTMRIVSAGVPYDEGLARQLVAWLRPKAGASAFGPERALARMGPRGIAHLVAILDDPTSDLQLTVLGGLASAPPEDLKQILPAISQQILVEDEATREAALNVLMPLQGDCEACLPALQTALQDESILVVQAALGVMQSMGPRGAPAIDEVFALLDYGDERVTDAACQALGAMRANAAAVIPALGALVRDESRTTAARALAAYGAPGVAELLRQFDAGDAYVRDAVLDGVAALGPKAAFATPRLVALIEGEDERLRYRAVQIAGGIGPGGGRRRAGDSRSGVLRQDPWPCGRRGTGLHRQGGRGAAARGVAIEGRQGSAVRPSASLPRWRAGPALRSRSWVSCSMTPIRRSAGWRCRPSPPRRRASTTAARRPRSLSRACASPCASCSSAP